MAVVSRYDKFDEFAAAAAAASSCSSFSADSPCRAASSFFSISANVLRSSPESSESLSGSDRSAVDVGVLCETLFMYFTGKRVADPKRERGKNRRFVSRGVR